jgi:hypothetical protein
MDANRIDQLIAQGSSREGIAEAIELAKQKISGFPENGCAANLSALLRLSGSLVRMHSGAGSLARTLEFKRRWTRIPLAKQLPGDVGVCLSKKEPPGADHIYLVIEIHGTDEMLISDNQSVTPHLRLASGRSAGPGAKGTTPTEYFLRAT